MKYSLECEECGEDVFCRATDAYGDGEECECPGCGSHCVIAVDDASDPPVAYCQSFPDWAFKE